MNPSEHIDKQIAELADWRGQMLSQLRKLIHAADPDITEEWKWDTAVWSHGGLVCAVATFKKAVKSTCKYVTFSAVYNSLNI